MATEFIPKTDRPATVRKSMRALAAKGASPAAAAAFAAGIAYLWFEVGFRLAFTYSPDFDARWVLWNGRVGDIAAMWLTISGLAAVLGLGLWFAWRRKEHVGFVAEWTILLLGSAIAAPMLGEIGTPTGDVASGSADPTAVTVTALVILGIAIVLVAAALMWLRRNRGMTLQ